MSPMDETETDATVKEETTTTELVTPTDEAPEGEDTCEEQVENTEDAETRTETPDSPELD